MAAPNLVIIRNPFSRLERDYSAVPIDGQTTVADLVKLSGLDCDVSAAIDGQVITREEWERRCIRTGEQLTLIPVLHGGDSGGLLRTVAFIALAVAAGPIAGALAPALGLSGALAVGALTVGVNIVGGLLINALLPPAKQNLSNATNLSSFDASPAYAWSPRNTNEPGVPIARQYGKLRRKGNIIATYDDVYGADGTQQQAHLLVDLGMGPINSVSDILLNGQPLATYSGVSYEIRLGTLNQSAIADFNDTPIETTVNRKVVNGTPVNYTVGTGADKVQVEVTFSQGLYYSNDQGGLDNVTVKLRCHLKKNGTEVDVQDMTVTAATVKAIRRVFTFDNLDNSATYSFTLENLSTDQTSSRYGDDCYLSLVRRIVKDDFAYPRTALLAVKAIATDQISGGFDVSCLVEGLKVNVYNGTTWSQQYSRNPAWVVWDALTQPVWSEAGAVVEYEGIDPANLVLDDFVAFAAYCDEPLADGDVRFRVDGVQESGTNVFDAANEILSSARAVLIPMGTRFTVVWDRPRTVPAQLFSVGNTKISGFREHFLPQAERIVRFEADFLDENQDYQRDVLSVINADFDTPGAQVSNIAMKWATRPAQVWRECKYRLNKNKYLNRYAELDVDIDAMACRVGDMVYVQSDVPQWGEGGRLASATTTTVTLDKAVTLYAGKTYQVCVRFADDSIVFRNVTNSAGTYTTLTVDTAFSTAPAQFDLYAVGEVGVAVKPFLVVSIAKNGDQSATLSLIEYNASIYNCDTDAPALPTVNYSRAAPVALSGVSYSDRLRVDAGGGVYTDLQVDFTLTDPDLKVKAVNLEKIGPDGTWALAATGTSSPIVLPNVTSGATYTLRLKAVDVITYAVTDAVEYKVLGKTAPPSDVTAFTVARSGDTLNFTWRHIDDIDRDYYEIRQGSIWTTATSVGATKGNSYAITSKRGGTFLVKAFDTSGFESKNAAQVVVSDNAGINVVYSYDESTGGWNGTTSNALVLSGGVALIDGTTTWAGLTGTWSSYTQPWLFNGSNVTSGTYVTEVEDIGMITTAQVSIVPTVELLAKPLTWNDYSSPWASYAAPDWTWQGLVNAVSASFEIQTSTNGTTWSAWTQFVPGAYTMRYLRYRVTLKTTDANYRPYLTGLLSYVDVPDRVVHLGGLSVPSGGLAVSFNPPFVGLQTIQATLQAGATGDTYKLTGKSSTGVTINVFDLTGTAKAGVVDIDAFGYGSVN